MKILGIDPGIGRTGWGIIEVQKTTPSMSHYGCIETFSSETMENRLNTLYIQISEVILNGKPDVVAVEELFFNTNAKTALTVGHARGVLLLAIAQHKIPLFTYTPLQVKMALTGYGRAEKTQIGHMVKILLRLKTVPKPDDSADALAIALAHSFFKKSGTLS